MDIRTNIINDVIMSMQSTLTEDQLNSLKQSLYMKLNEYEVQERCTEIVPCEDKSEMMLKQFIATKRVQGLSENTLQRYIYEIKKLLAFLQKDLNDVTTFDLRYYLSMRKEVSIQTGKEISNRTLDGMRRCIRSFFSFLYVEGLIDKNPSAALTQIKYEKKVKKSFSDTDLEKLRRSCKTVRDRALIEFLYSTGCRVSEVVRINRNDINFDNNSVLVLGKGSKQREVYINEVAMLYLKEYLESRSDPYPALFIGKGTDRLHKNGIEALLRRIGEAASVENVYPHRYRRTMATNMINRGAQIQEVSVLLGHEDVRTTQIYCAVNINNVRMSHSRYIV